MRKLENFIDGSMLVHLRYGRFSMTVMERQQ